MAGYIGTKAVLLSTTAATVTGDATIGGDLNVDTGTLFVDSTNNRVGIGTGGPFDALHVEGTIRGNVNSASDENIRLTTTGGGGFVVDVDDATVANPTWSIRTFASEPLAFDVGGTERMRIDSSGNVLVGTTDTPNISDKGVGILNVVSGGQDYGRINVGKNYNGTVWAFRCYHLGSSVGGVQYGNVATAFITSSDYRLKEDVQPMTGASDRVLALKPCNFAWKADGSRVDGFIAHEAQEVVPEAVTGTKDAVDDEGNPDYQGIDQSKFVPLLTAALQEALTEIADLKARVAALEAV